MGGGLQERSTGVCAELVIQRQRFWLGDGTPPGSGENGEPGDLPAGRSRAHEQAGHIDIVHDPVTSDD